ncbi:MAG: response regulator [Spirochaetales bacterium]|nr:response regulator [Spirochaetales bacterium]
MKNPRVLIVEDESIVAIDISARLETLGYIVAGCVMSADEALSDFGEFDPDLVLMDIHLKGRMDGIEAAEIIQREHGTPLIFITAYADKDTLARAKITQPFGYILKPFQERELMITIEMALYKHGLEKKLHEKEMLLSATLGSINDGIVTIDNDGNILYQNKIAQTILGPLHHCTDIFTCLEDREIFGSDKFITFAKFSNIPVHVSVNNLGGQKMQVVVVRDYSDIVNSEAQLIRAKKMAEEVSEAKSNFMANMSHELRTPLNSIIGMTDLVLESIDDHDLREYLTISRHASESLLSLINSILDFSKIEAGKMDLHYTPFDLDEVIENAMRKVAAEAAKKNIELWSNLAVPLSSTYIGDPKRVFQILLNIVSNAVKFTSHGFIHITRSIFTDSDKATEFEIRVTDSGVGIAQEKIGSIFDAFTQQDDSYTRRHGGTGLGLAIVKNLLGLMGGSIVVSSRPGQGSEFVIRVGFDKHGPKENLHFADNFHVWLASEKEYISGYIRDCAASMGAIVHELPPDMISAVTLPEEGIHVLIAESAVLSRESIQAAAQNDNPGFSKYILVEQFGAAAPQTRRPKCPACSVLLYPFRRSDLYNRICGIPDPGLPTETTNRHQEDRGKRVLLAEDDVHNQVLLSRILTKHGYTVIIAANGDEAIRLYREDQPSIVVMDVQMPKKDGIETTKVLRSIETNVHVPILALTAHALEGFREQCLDAGMDDYITKPFKVPVLLEKIEMLINKDGKHAPAKQEETQAEQEAASIVLQPHMELLKDNVAEKNYMDIINTASKLKQEAEQKELKRLKALCFKFILAARNEDDERLLELLTVLGHYK